MARCGTLSLTSSMEDTYDINNKPIQYRLNMTKYFRKGSECGAHSLANLGASCLIQVRDAGPPLWSGEGPLYGKARGSLFGHASGHLYGPARGPLFGQTRGPLFAHAWGPVWPGAEPPFGQVRRETPLYDQARAPVGNWRAIFMVIHGTLIKSTATDNNNKQIQCRFYSAKCL